MGSGKINHSIIKAFQVLELFTKDKPNWGVRELALELGANKSTTYRMMATLNSVGVLKQDPLTEKYSLGLKLFELGARVDIHEAIISKTHPVLTSVAREITETVHLGIFQQNQVLMIDRVESPQGLKLNSVIGSYSPAYCTGVGKVLLSNLSRQEINAFCQEIPFTQNTEYTILEEEKLWSELQQIRKQGYALDREEKEYGLICVAVPVYNTANEMIAALSAAGPAQRFKPDKLSSYVDILQTGASSIKQTIGRFFHNDQEYLSWMIPRNILPYTTINIWNSISY